MERSLLFLLLLLLALTGCADTVEIGECLPPEPYGFWGGLWHGLIAPFSFIGSLFSEKIAVYAVNNSGAWYDLGFIIGLSSLGLGSSKSKRLKG